MCCVVISIRGWHVVLKDEYGFADTVLPDHNSHMFSNSHTAFRVKIGEESRFCHVQGVQQMRLFDTPLSTAIGHCFIKSNVL